jgi:MOSC domain-containing protein YiiM
LRAGKQALLQSTTSPEFFMKVVSLSVGGPREVEWHGRTVLTSIFKTPVDRRLQVSSLNFEGDKQSDLSVHGGVEKAVYVYPSEHYAYWRDELPGTELPWAVFGENLTTLGLSEADVRIGDRFHVGSAEFTVTEPRLPCYKLGIRFGRPDILKRFLQSGRTGFYFAVVQEGEVGAGDSIELIARSDEVLTVADVVNLYTVDGKNQELLRRAVQSSILPESWRAHFRKRLLEPTIGPPE